MKYSFLNKTPKRHIRVCILTIENLRCKQYAPFSSIWNIWQKFLPCSQSQGLKPLALRIMLFEIIVVLAALLGSVLSFFCGFGLGTTLLPAFMLFFPPEVAIAATALVHMANNVFKLFLVGRQADWSIIKGFGLLSVLGAVAGAFCLKYVAHLPVITTYSLGGKMFEVTYIRLVISLVIIVFAIIELIPYFQAIRLPRRILPAGGLISGFFGGLSGHQGALRSAFLMKAGLSKQAFIGTRVVCAFLVDTSRIGVYATEIKSGWSDMNIGLLAAASIAAFTGAYFGNKLMKKTELKTINLIVAVSLVIFGIGFGMGLI